MNNQQQPNHPYNPQVQPNANAGQPTNGHNPYEFIMQANAKPPKEPTSFAKRLLIAVGGIFLLFALLGVGLSIFLPKNGASEGLVGLVSDQQAIIGLADSVATSSSASTLKAYALNTKLSVQTNQNEIKDYVLASGTKIDDKVLSQATNAEATAKLEAAKDSPEYDTTARAVLNDALTAYALKLKKLYGESGDENEKAAVQKAFLTAGTLLEQGKPEATVSQ